MTVVHMIGNAHLDPVWLWRWPAGAGEAVATCRTAAELLDAYPDFVFTRSDVWVHQQIERLAPELFERVRRFVAAGRWQIVGGWHVQADCNLPTAESFRQHARIGRSYFRSRFGMKVTVGYNVDSFGHHAMLPRRLRESGFDSYVMMRPMPHEKELPGPLFRWRSPDRAEVLTWRIVGAYAAGQTDLADHVHAAIAAADPRVGHVMCFYGVGDHGGGPTRQQIEWIREHRDAIPGAQLVFSHPRAFFDAVQPNARALPVVEGELQRHAMGCYSVMHELKRHMRRAEHGLVSAEQAVAMFPPEAPKGWKKDLAGAWEQTLFNQFHDTYGGTIPPSALDDTRDQLGAARDAAERVMRHTFFRWMRRLPPDRRQRLVAFNPSDSPFAGYVGHEPWTAGGEFDGWLADESGQPVPSQKIRQETNTGPTHRELVFPVAVAARGHRVFHLRTDPSPAMPPPGLKADGEALSNGFWRVRRGEGPGLMQLEAAADGRALFRGGLTIVVRQDHSDTWSHGIPAFGEPVAGHFGIERLAVEDRGPVRAAWRMDGRFDASEMALWVRLYCGDPRVEIALWVNWRQKQQVAKLALPLREPITERVDGIPGGCIVRPTDGHEYPVHDWTLVRQAGGRSLGVVCPDSFGLDVTAEALGFTLLRAPPYSWHDPLKLEEDAFYRWTDQGEHTFRFILVPDATVEALPPMALGEHRPPVCHDWTAGMGGA